MKRLCLLIVFAGLLSSLGEATFPILSKDEQIELQKAIGEQPTAVLEGLSQKIHEVGPATMEEEGFRGDFLGFRVADVAIKDDMLAFSAVLVWRSSPDTVSIATYFLVGNLTDGSLLDGRLEELRDIPLMNLAALQKVDLFSESMSKQEVPPLVEAEGPLRAEPTPTPEQSNEESFYERNKESIDKSVIAVTTAVVTKVLIDWVSSLSNR
ncbi:MAG: hypothetical protein SFU53_14925 [Terrimicrobiaceae bacterium]|nr:hypothetical protein [Terrimicrobiaceae bacterium]